VHGELQILEHFLDFARSAFRAISVPPASRSHATPARNEPVNHSEVDRGRGDDPQSVPFSCRLENATSGNTQQLAATSGNSQRSEAKAFKQQAATPGNTRQLNRNPAVNRMVAGSNPA
jgi:hypothetical protein